MSTGATEPSLELRGTGAEGLKATTSYIHLTIYLSRERLPGRDLGDDDGGGSSGRSSHRRLGIGVLRQCLGRLRWRRAHRAPGQSGDDAAQPPPVIPRPPQAW